MERNFGDYLFVHICEIKLERDDTQTIKVNLPQERYTKKDEVSLHAFGIGPFCKFRIPNKLNFSGVYILTLNDLPAYIGECLNLSKRYNMGYGNISPRNCYQGGQPTNCRINNLICEAVQSGQQI